MNRDFSGSKRKESMRSTLAAMIALFSLSLPAGVSALPAVPGTGLAVPQTIRSPSAPVIPQAGAINPQNPRLVDQWILVPDWLAGTWQAEEQTVIASFNYAHGVRQAGLPQKIPVKRVSSIGTQLDNQGRIWHAAAPYTKVIDAGSFNEIHDIDKLIVLTDTPTMFEISTQARVTRVSKSNNEILGRFLEEATIEYTPLEDGRILVDFQILDKNTDGTPIFSSRAMCTVKRIASFAPVKQDYRGKLDLMFHRFLLQTGQESLMPAPMN